jgi:hypothetical protein
MTYSTPVIVATGVLLIVIAWLAGIEPWLLAVGAAVALVMFLVERGQR